MVGEHLLTLFTQKHLYDDNKLDSEKKQFIIYVPLIEHFHSLLLDRSSSAAPSLSDLPLERVEP